MLTLTQKQIDICNKSLLQIGSKTITAQDDNVEARICEANYNMALEEVLSAHTWSCATKQAVIVSTEIDALDRYIYTLPDGFVRLVEVNQYCVQDVAYEIIGKSLLMAHSNRIHRWLVGTYYAKGVLATFEDFTYQSKVGHRSTENETPDDSDKWQEVDGLGYTHIKYVSYIEPDEFSGLFLSCLVPLLAANMATPLSSSDSKRINLFNEYKTKLHEARLIDLTQRNVLQTMGNFNLSRY